jgi:catechol-2,3-dioxygenase
VDYFIAKIHEKTADKARAAEYYQKFLGLMKSADPGIPEVEDARTRLASLKN